MTGHAGLILTGEFNPSLILYFVVSLSRCLKRKEMFFYCQEHFVNCKNWGHPNHLLSSITPMKNVYKFFHREGKKLAINMAENL